MKKLAYLFFCLGLTSCSPFWIEEEEKIFDDTATVISKDVLEAETGKKVNLVETNVPTP